MFGFGKKAGPTIGLDINSSTISILQLEKTKTDIKVSRFASTLTPADIVREGLMSEPDAVGAAVDELIAGVGLRVKGPAPIANICVPGQSVVIRLLPVPKGMPADELNDVVKQEAINNLPFSLDEANLDWARVPGTQRTDPDGVEREDILLGAIQRSIVEGYWRMAEIAGITIGKLEITSLAAIRALTYSGQLGSDKGLNLVVNIRQDATDITLVNKSVPLFSRSVLLGVETMLESIQRSINASPEEAKQMLPKIQLLGVPTVEPRLGQAAQMARSVCGDLTAEVGRSLEFYMSQVGMIKVDEILVCGPGSAIPEIDQFIANRLNLSASIANPFLGIVYDNAQIVDNMRSHHTTLLGLLADTDSIPGKTVSLNLNQGTPDFVSAERPVAEEVVEDVPAPWFVPALIAGIVIALIVAGAWSYFQYAVIPAKVAQLNKLDEDIKKSKEDLERLSKVNDNLNDLRDRKKSLDDVVNHGTPMSVLLKALKDNVPPGVTIGNVKISGGSSTLTGATTDFSKVSNFAINLQGSNVFTRADISSIKRHYQSPTVILYELEATIAPDINSRSLSQADVATSREETPSPSAPANISQASGAVVLNFYSARALPCQQLKPVIDQAEKKYSGQFQFQTVDIEDQSNSELLKKYNIKQAPVLVFLDAAGRVTDRVEGFTNDGKAVFASCEKLGKVASKATTK